MFIPKSGENRIGKRNTSIFLLTESYSTEYVPSRAVQKSQETEH